MAEITKSMMGFEEIGKVYERLTKKVENSSQISRLVKNLDYEHIGPSVSVGLFSEDMLTNVTAICRRKFKKKDVIAFVDVSEEYEYESGIIFTESGIFHWNNEGKDIKSVEYSAISEVDYDETNVYIKSENTTMEISMGDYAEEDKYPRYMYTFIMDIVDYINGEYDEVDLTSEDENEGGEWRKYGIIR